MTDTTAEDLAIGLAHKLQTHLRNDPTLQIEVLAANVGASEAKVITILDEYAVDEKGRITWAGPGAGGPWISDAQRAKL